jgi:hypothetical protein
LEARIALLEQVRDDQRAVLQGALAALMESEKERRQVAEALARATERRAEEHAAEPRPAKRGKTP